MFVAAILALFTLFGGLVSAQIPGMPECAIGCLMEAVTAVTPCQIHEIACSCQPQHQEAIREFATPCVFNSCGADVAINEVIPAAIRLCAQFGRKKARAPSTSSSASTTSVPATRVGGGAASAASTSSARTTATYARPATTSGSPAPTSPAASSPATSAASASKTSASVVTAGAAAKAAPLAGLGLVGLAALAL